MADLAAVAVAAVLWVQKGDTIFSVLGFLVIVVGVVYVGLVLFCFLFFGGGVGLVFG